MIRLSSRPSPFWLRLLIDVLIVVLAAFVLLSGLLYWYIRRSQPPLDGVMHLAGLRQPVHLLRDEFGVAHIQAANLHDLYLAEGFAMAQDRLWQMDLMRRMAEGRLAEVFGQQAVAADEKARLLGLNRAAEANAEDLLPQERTLLDAFSTGVNLYLVQQGKNLPLEFRLLHYRPTLWRPVDTLAIAAQMYRTLTSNYRTELEYQAFFQRLGPRLTDELFPSHSPWDVIPGQLPRRQTPQLPVEASLPAPASALAGRPGQPVAGMPPRRFRVAPFAPPSPGSNDWVVAASRSATGRPILANDPHLDYQVPGLWWAVDLSMPGLHAAGVTLAGAPGVVIGHNQHIAWGVTNLGADVQDLYRVQIRNDDEVLTPNGWRLFTTVHERIHVRNAPDTVLNVQVTPFGPIVAHDATGPLALRWVIGEPQALQLDHVFLAIDRAANWQQFEQALAMYPGPAQNFVYADVDGHIGYQCAGWIPKRSPGSRFLPASGADPSAQWSGFIPFQQLPRSFDPPTGLLATANGRITPDGYPWVISYDWDAPNRTRRIYTLLSSRRRWTPTQMNAIQMDVISIQDRDFAQALVAAVGSQQARGKTVPPTVSHALDQLRTFEGRMDRNEVAPTLVVATRAEFLRRILTARVGARLAKQYRWREAPVLEQALLNQRPDDWLPPAWRGQGWDAFLLDCLRAVVEDGAAQNGSLRGSRRWGRQEILDVRHPVFSHLPFVRSYADLGPLEMNGSPLTVKQTTPTLGPSMRFVADLSDWDHSTLTLFAGESGMLFNAHYRDQFPDYLSGHGLPLWFSPDAVRQHTKHELRLDP